MSYRVKAKYSGFIPKMKQRQINRVLKQSFGELGVQFFVENLRRRFTTSHGWKVGYSRRTNKYNKKKKKKLGHTQPFVYSGVTQKRALSLNFTKINATATKGNGKTWLTVNAPALNFHPKLRAQFEEVGQYEVPPLERYLEKRAEQNFETFSETTTETIG